MKAALRISKPVEIVHASRKRLDQAYEDAQRNRVDVIIYEQSVWSNQISNAK
ncbi:hypothetical protein BT69DRAFT_1278194 [Atractiella rhizophila]|nr:hypothetical protein BT69DRAFT_1278194 [Atractiella rhizophila]